MIHPSSKIGPERVCPITGKQFKWSWSKKTVFDVCDQCDDNAPPSLSALNEKRKRQQQSKSQQ
jgi:hypothetical protein